MRDLGLEGQYKKQGTPSMGGIIILASIIIPTLLFARLENIYIILDAGDYRFGWGLSAFLMIISKYLKRTKKDLQGGLRLQAR